MFAVYDIKKSMCMFLISIQPIADETQSFLHPKKLSHGDGDTYQQHMPTKTAETDSYTNLYEADVPLGGSAHSLRNQLVEQVVPGSPHQQHISMKPGPYVPRRDGHVMALTSPECTAAPPPYDYVSSHSIRLVSPLVGSPSLYHGQVLGTTKGSGPTVLANEEKYPLMPLSQSSYSQLPSQASAGGSPLPTRTKAGGLLRYGSPTFPPPTARDSGHSSPLSAAASGIQSIPGAVRRPVSFVRALEMSDQLAGAPTGRLQQPQQQLPHSSGLQPTAEEDERAYGSSYEIAV